DGDEARPESPPPPRPGPPVSPSPSPSSGDADLRIGTAEGGRGVAVPLEILRKHTVLFAGSGSGKTVLIRRMLEEAALLGVSSIVLDTNNDLARLGDPWPSPPSTWQNGDPERAKEYFASTEVVVWTPRREAGRPLAFQPLPDFAAVRDDRD